MSCTYPRFVYDGDCSFCQHWVDRWQAMTDDSVAYVPYQKLSISSQEKERYQQSSQLEWADGTAYSGAYGIFWLYFLAGKPSRLFLYRHLPVFAALSEWLYRWIARHREGFYRATCWLWGRHYTESGFVIGPWLYLRALGGVYLIAFGSALSQLLGLIGKNGIMPAKEFMQQAVASGASILEVPTFAWLSQSDSFLLAIGWIGIAAALLLIFDYWPKFSLITLYLLYLSLTVAGQLFFSYQWDMLLLEVGFLSIFIAPWRSRPHRSYSLPLSRLFLFVFILVLFKLLFLSGVLKLLHGSTWQQLTALEYHFWTQPLPTPFAWFVQQLPAFILRVLTAITLLIEVVVPFLLLLPRRLRFGGAWAIILFEIAILLTGNYTFFNLLTIALTFMLFDDQAWRSVLGRMTPRLPSLRQYGPYRGRILALVASLFIVLQLSQIAMSLSLPQPSVLTDVRETIAPFHVVNGYGLFVTMTTRRPAVLIQGTTDGEHWKAYDFRYAPDFVNQSLPVVAPHQPRLDWQLWFASLGNPSARQWFPSFVRGLLKNEPAIVDLLRKNPFPETPPQAVRAVLYEYRFTNWTEWQQSGHWWQRERQDIYMRPVSR